MALDFSALERFYENLADTLDTVSDDQKNLYLCKLCLLLAQASNDGEEVIVLVSAAKKNLEQ